MHPIDFLLIFTAPLDAIGARYMVTGSVAGIAYGEPRLTNGVDIVLGIDEALADQLEVLYPADRFYCPPLEVIHIESRRAYRGHFNIIHHESDLKADVFTAGMDPLHVWGLANRRRVSLDASSGLWIAPLEYVILKKLAYYREGRSEKHLIDLRGMMAVSGHTLDRVFLEDHLDSMNLRAEWSLVVGGHSS